MNAIEAASPQAASIRAELAQSAIVRDVMKAVFYLLIATKKEIPEVRHQIRKQVLFDLGMKYPELLAMLNGIADEQGRAIAEIFKADRELETILAGCRPTSQSALVERLKAKLEKARTDDPLNAMLLQIAIDVNEGKKVSAEQLNQIEAANWAPPGEGVPLDGITTDKHGQQWRCGPGGDAEPLL